MFILLENLFLDMGEQYIDKFIKVYKKVYKSFLEVAFLLGKLTSFGGIIIMLLKSHQSNLENDELNIHVNED